MATGIVYKSTGSWYSVREEGTDNTWQARLKGVMKMDGLTSTNPIAVGDVVDFEPEAGSEGRAMISHIHDRKNQVNRQSPRMKSQQHIVASNLDRSLLIATLREPRTSQGFIDRFLVACELYHVQAGVVFNKADLYRDKEKAQYETMKTMYDSIGYPSFLLSLKDGTGMEGVDEFLHGRVTLISGHSGVGKSSFINTVIPNHGIRTQEVSGWSGKGQHTTTFAEMYDLPGGGRIIDTPGMKEFGLVGVEKEELSGYFPEMRAVLNDCAYNNCQHLQEPVCAVKDAVREGKIWEERYYSYCGIWESLGEEKY